MTSEHAPGHDYAELLDLAREVAHEAAALIADLRSRGVEVADTKTSPTDVVTQVDHAAEELIHRRLLGARPGDGFVGEEGGDTPSTSGVTWVVDPIDGTVNFLYGIPLYSVSIAARVEDEVVAGVVVDVVRRESFTATRGGGAFVDGVPIQVRDAAPLSERLVITGFNYQRATRILQAQAAARLLPEVRDIRRLGSAALDLCFVAAGRADNYVEEGLNEWDLAAGGLIVDEAGGRVETRPGVGGKTCVVAGSRGGFVEFFDLVADLGFFGE